MVCNKCGHPKHMHRKRPIYEGCKGKCTQSLLDYKNRIIPCPCDGYME